MIALTPAQHNLYVKASQGRVTKPKSSPVWYADGEMVANIEDINTLFANGLVVKVPHGVAEHKLEALMPR